MNPEFGVALAQGNYVVGDIEGNEAHVIKAAVRARDELNSRFVLFPELTLSGYPPEDLLYRSQFIHECEEALKRITDSVRGIALVVGHPQRDGDALYNAASVIDDGRLLTTYRKHHLPNYGVFDEKRYFVSGHSPAVVEIDAVESGARMIFTLNGSPFDANKIVQRENEVVTARAKHNNVSIVYVNLVGGQDELVFDGGSLVADNCGNIAVRAPHFTESLARASFRREGDAISCTGGEISAVPDSLEAIYRAITLGTRDYIEKNGFKGAVLGLSGGIDSALTLAIVADAIGPEHVEAILMPSRYTRQMSLDDGIWQAKTLGTPWSVISIEPIFEAFLSQLSDTFQHYQPDVTEENIQARCRGTLLMSISNKKGSLLITTGNKSEVAVGYATLYGDMAGGFAPIKDVPKTLVYQLAHYRNNRYGTVIPKRVIEREPSAELAENQSDTDSLPAYEVLDEIMKAYVEDGLDLKDIVDRGLERRVVERVINMVKRNEYKRRQAPPGVRITSRAFGRDRRYPITSRW